MEILPDLTTDPGKTLIPLEGAGKAGTIRPLLFLTKFIICSKAHNVWLVRIKVTMIEAVFGTMRRLHDRGRDCRGLAVDADGVTLGPDWELVRRTPAGYRAAEFDEIVSVLRYAFDNGIDPERFSSQIAGVAKALNGGDLVKAQILGLQIPLGPLSERDLWRLDVGSALVKAGYDPNQARDDHGQWSQEGGSNTEGSSSVGPKLNPVQYAVPFPFPFPSPAPGIFGGAQPKPKDDEAFPYDPPVGATNSANDNTQTNADAAANDNQPQVCPPPTKESMAGRSERALAYQEQITGLERGRDVTLNNVRYDGCDVRTGNMLEAKGPGLLWMFLRPGNWAETTKFYFDSMKQAEDQSKYSGGRTVEWHFADKIIADFFRIRFRNDPRFANIVVIHTPAKVLKFISDQFSAPNRQGIEL